MPYMNNINKAINGKDIIIFNLFIRSKTTSIHKIVYSFIVIND